MVAPILCVITPVQCVQEADKRKQEACGVVSWSWALASSSRPSYRCFIHLSCRHNNLEEYILVLIPCATLH